MQGELLPLFPLQVVLFPSSILPLHIFEERYKELINECLGEEKEFGINLVQENALAKVGCTASVTEVLQRYENGRMDILAEGRRRYSLDEVVESSTLYSVGKVEFLHPSEERVDSILLAETIELHNELVQIVYKNNRYLIDVVAGSAQLSFRLAQKAGMDLPLRQKLLELDSENDRLRILHSYFKEVIPKLQHLDEVERIIKSDGYVVN